MSKNPFEEAVTRRAADNIRADLDRRWMEAITLGPAVADPDRQCTTRTVSVNSTPSQTLDLATMRATIQEFEERFHNKDVAMFEAMLACGVLVVFDPNLAGDQMVLRVGTGRHSAVRTAMNNHFDKTVRA